MITPSHNPPEDGGFKYNPPNGGPADTSVTKWIENRANDLIAKKLDGIKRIPYTRALAADTTHRHDYITAYVNDLANVIDFAPLADTTLKLAVDPLGGAGVYYWPRIAEKYKLAFDSPQPLRRSHLPLHDPRLGRTHPHGLLLSVRDGQHDRE